MPAAVAPKRTQFAAVLLASDSAAVTPLRQWVGYYCGPTNAKSITSPPDGTHAPGVWGHDEGPSYQMAAPSGDNRIVFYWGDSITAYNVSMTYPDAYQVRSCDGGMGNDGSCIGVDTVSYLSSADAANISTCTFLNDLDY